MRTLERGGKLHIKGRDSWKVTAGLDSRDIDVCRPRPSYFLITRCTHNFYGQIKENGAV